MNIFLETLNPIWRRMVGPIILGFGPSQTSDFTEQNEHWKNISIHALIGIQTHDIYVQKWHISHRTTNGISLLSETGIVYFAEFINHRKAGQREEKNDIKWPNYFKKLELYWLFLLLFLISGCSQLHPF